ncbi:DUF7133 domain-containing protein [Tuwongella immobilis]|uniref:Glucose/sorbosone dehydrogenase n=1 Tax=Tuwongella immobilis TaxID=692036 RepID=A0A6C2YJF3_9BACT|nr:hypothetical protein [Tuwongella immobilis]VIP01494.1 Glucose/sorbosone dehydrogenase OS=Singulisphaera acidiphila (strain ATCC BAA-1392 / DSM 18658 / VKM B-2454 / MOB10) GN=Sinac_5788 PE=4 SV=1 [Tuwongella immobilis]VTR98574.1 Glucose/sorbosone dehydrogenase OS=Singulisphaera acidiphila (strain ATCC BAA-1392 / DSM 18658 / VKM B-2454 / MOB10) GN=Sinac_5788 PE=4 SV=1 [Tuwongella immobilis]
MRTLLVLALLLAGTIPARSAEQYVKKPTRSETIAATLAASGLPNLTGKWYLLGPFDNDDNKGFETPFPPEKSVDLSAKLIGRDGQEIRWKEFPEFKLGSIVNLAKFGDNNNIVCYLTTEIEVSDPLLMPLSLGSDDSIAVFLNGKEILRDAAVRPAAPDQNRTEMKLVPGKNRLLIKVSNIGSGFEVYVQPELPKLVSAALRKRLDRDFPPAGNVPSGGQIAAEAKYYEISTIPLPSDCVLEVGGLGVRPDGKLLACTRRGEVWLVHNPNAAEVEDIKLTRFASGLHEALGLWVQDNKTVLVTQRPELTKLVDRDGDGVADEYETFCDQWGASGDYHEFAFGPARDKDGNFFITLNVGFGGGHQAKGAWRGWCVKINPQGELEPWAYGLRSPNGVNFSPDGDLFYTDNQGEWVASNKMHHIRKGEFYGHAAGLRWLKDSPFKGQYPDNPISGMLYDGQKGPNPNSPRGLPKLTPPVIWFPYGRMGQSVTEPRWDTTGGKFGPFAGQCFVGDQTKSMIMRVALEKINGTYQGACFPFRSGFQCGVNRIVFDENGTLYAGQTNRGWGSVGGKDWGLQRLKWTGEVPFEISIITLTKTGFDLTFTKPIQANTAATDKPYGLTSYTYNYFSNYGSPEVDRRNETVSAVRVGKDGKSVSIDVPNLKVGRVYEFRIDGILATDGESLLHPEGYYTLNHLR